MSETTPTKGKLPYFGLISDTSKVNQSDTTPTIELTFNSFEYDIENMKDTKQRFMEIERSVLESVSKIETKMKLPMQNFDMWGVATRDPKMSSIIKMIREWDEY